MKKLTFPKAKAAAGEIPELQPGQLTPLAWLLQRLNDSTVAATTRDRLAAIAAPYCHPKLVEKHQGRKVKAQKAAAMAGQGTPWGKDLEFETRTQ